jgi:enoyl-CoA hydratase/carnithine racemase
LNDFDFIKYEKADHIAYLTINRPEVMNALHPPAHAELARAWEAFENDEDSWVAIVTGTGDRAFSAGMDLRNRAEANARGEQPYPSATANRGFGGLTNPRHAKIWKPIIAAVNGYALGGGLELAMASDIIIAADHAQFGLPEPKRGIIAGAGGVHRLPRHLPLKIAIAGASSTRSCRSPSSCPRRNAGRETSSNARLYQSARRSRRQCWASR